MSGIPVVITDKYGIPVRQVTSGAPLMTVATNGRGIPIVLSTRGMAFVVEGANPVVPSAFTAGQWSVTGANTAINVTISSLPYNGGSAITAVQYRLNGGSWVSSGGTGSFTISSLTNGTTYTVELRAVNAIGNGLDSDDKAATPATVPSAPTLALTPADGQVTVAWTDGSTGGSAITARRLYRSTTSGFTPGPGNLIAISPAFPYADTDLTNDTAYYYKGIAENVIGDSAASTQQEATPTAEPVTTLIQIGWEQPNGTKLSEYPDNPFIMIGGTTTEQDKFVVQSGQASANGVTFSGLPSRLPIAVLNLGDEYRYRIYPINGVYGKDVVAAVDESNYAVIEGANEETGVFKVQFFVGGDAQSVPDNQIFQVAGSLTTGSYIDIYKSPDGKLRVGINGVWYEGQGNGTPATVNNDFRLDLPAELVDGPYAGLLPFDGGAGWGERDFEIIGSGSGGGVLLLARNDALSRTEITNTADFPGAIYSFLTDAGVPIDGVSTAWIDDADVPDGVLYKARANGDAATDSALHAIERDDNIFRINFADEADGALNGEQSIVAPASYQIISGALTVDAGEQSFFCDLGVTDQSVTLEPYYRVGSNDLDSPSTARAIRLCASSAGTTYLEAQIKGNKVQFTKRTPGGGWEGFWPLIELPFGQDFDDKAFRCQVVWDGGLPYFAIFNDDVRLDTAGGLGINANADPAQTNITQQTGMGFSGPEGTGSANPSYPIKVLKTISADNVVDVGIVVATVEFTEPTDTVPPSIEFNGTTDYAAIQAVVVAIDGRELGDINSFTGLTPGAMSLIIPSPPEGMGQAAFLRVRQTSNPSNYTDYRLGVLPVYAPVEPLYIGSQSAGLAPFGVNDFMRNRVDQGNWIWRGGASNNENATLNAQGFPVGPMPSGATGLAIKLWEGIYIYEGVRDGAFRVEYLNGSPSDFRAIPGLSNIAASAKDATGMTLTLSMAGPTNYYSGSVEFDLTAIPADGFQVTCIPVGDTGSSTDILAAEATEVWNSDVLPKMPWRDMKDSGAENATGVPKFPTAAGKVNFAIDFVDKTGCESYYHVLNWGDVADRLETVPRAWVESFNSSLLTSASILALEVGNEVWNDFYLAQMLSMGARATTVEGCYDEGVVPEGATAYYAFDKVNYGAEAPDGGKTTATFEPGDVFTCMSLYTRLLVECIATVTVPIGTAVPNSGENAYFRVLASGLEITTAARRYQSHLQAQAGILGKSIMGDRCKSILGIFVLDTVDTVCDLLEFNDAYLNIDHFSPSFYAGGKVEYASTWWAALYASDFATFKSEYYALRRATTDDIISKLVVLKHGVVEEMINRGHNIADIPTLGHLYEGLDHNVIGNIPDADRAGVMAAMDACHKSAEEGIETAYMFSEIKEKIGGTIYTFADVSPLIYNGSADNGILQQWGLRTRQYDGTWNSNGADELRYNAAVAIMAA